MACCVAHRAAVRDHRETGRRPNRPSVLSPATRIRGFRLAPVLFKASYPRRRRHRVIEDELEEGGPHTKTADEWVND
jgi:hypothetical protein